MVFPMLFPTLAAAMMKIPNFHPGSDYKYAMGVGAALMAGWTFLLAWAAINPIQRKDIFLLTDFPVLCGLIFSGMYAVHSQFILFANMLPMFIVQVGLSGLNIYCYYLAKRIEVTANNSK